MHYIDIYVNIKQNRQDDIDNILLVLNEFVFNYIITTMYRYLNIKS